MKKTDSTKDTTDVFTVKAEEALKKALKFARSENNKDLKSHLKEKQKYLEHILFTGIDSKNLEDSLIGVVCKKDNKMKANLIERALTLPPDKRIILMKNLKPHTNPLIKEFLEQLKNETMVLAYQIVKSKNLGNPNPTKEMFAAVGETVITDEKRKVAIEKVEATIKRRTTILELTPNSLVDDPDDAVSSVDDSDQAATTLENLLDDILSRTKDGTIQRDSILPTVSGPNLEGDSPTISTHLSHPQSCLSSNYTKAVIVFACALVLASAAYFVNMIGNKEVGSGREL